MRAIPQVAIDLSKSREVLMLRAYDDAQPKTLLKPGDPIIGKLTAGYGHTGNDVFIGMVFDEKQAFLWLFDDLMIAAKRLYAVVPQAIIDGLSNNQYAALLVFVLNEGADATWGIWKTLAAKAYSHVPQELWKFVYWHPGGVKQVSSGLVTRRAYEIVLWDTVGKLQ